MSARGNGRALRGWVAVLVLLVASGGARLGAATLEQQVRALISRYRLTSARVGVAVILGRGKLLVAINGRMPLKPASNMKVLTTAAGVHWLGLNHAYETTIAATSPLQGGILAGDIVVRGTGDPNISGRFYGGDPTALFRIWARKLKATGLKRITGDVLADDSWFRGARIPPTWDRAQESAWYSAPVSALNLNDNCLDFTIHPGSSPQQHARVEWVPRCPVVEVKGAPTTVAGKKAAVSVHRLAGKSTVVVSGKIGQSCPPWKGHVTVLDPSLFFVSALAKVFRDEGIEIDGKARRKDAVGVDATGEGKEPAGEGAHVLVQHTSTLAQDLPIINKRSQNLHAEVLLRSMGAMVVGEGSLAGGEKAVRAFLRRREIPADGLSLHDGCGLSHENRVTAEMLARVLYSMRREDYFVKYRESFAIAGVDGTLDDRFSGKSPVRENLYGKTGYIRGASCLSGYVVRGERVACFSILVNGMKSLDDAKRFQEKVGELVYRALAPAPS